MEVYNVNNQRQLKCVLKQQILDPTSGFYEWLTKVIILSENGKFMIYDTIDKDHTISNTPCTEVSINGAKYAKEWSSSSIIAGCGFDIIWSNGKIWSFLTDSEKKCIQLVGCINETIERTNQLPPLPPLPFQQSPHNNSNDVTMLQNDNIHESPIANYTTTTSSIPKTVPRAYNITESNRHSNVPNNVMISQKQANFPSDLSDIAINCHGDSPNNDGGSDTDSNKNDYDLSSLPSTDNKTCANKNLFNDNKGSSNSNNDDIQRKYNELRKRLDDESIQTQLAKDQMIRLQKELEARTLTYEQQLQDAWSSDKKTIEEIRNEAEKKILTMTHDNNQLQDASLKHHIEQNQRAIALLNEELSQERRRFSELIKKEIQARDTSESKEITLRQEIYNLQEINARINAELTRIREVAKTDAVSWEREKSHLLSNYDMQIAKLTAEKDSMVTKAHNDTKLKVEEITLKFHDTVKAVEESVVDTIRRQMDSDKIREITVMQKKCTKDIEVVRNEEKKAALLEINRIKASFSDRERQTADDLVQLEKIHNTRIKKLENICDDKSIAIQTCNKHIDELQIEVKRLEKEVKRKAVDHHKQLQEQASVAQDVHMQLQEACRHIQESKVREATYRDQLSKALEESRLQRAEYLEVKRQATNGQAQAYQWKHIAQETDVSTSATVTALQIARDEIAMLENELKRVKADNMKLQRSAQRNETLVYGIVSSPYHPNTTTRSPSPSSRIYPDENNSNYHSYTNNHNHNTPHHHTYNPKATAAAEHNNVFYVHQPPMQKTMSSPVTYDPFTGRKVLHASVKARKQRKQLQQ